MRNFLTDIPYKPVKSIYYAFTFSEEIIVWPLMNMSSGLCKTNISEEFTSFFSDIDDIDQFIPDQITFEMHGMMMNRNNNKCIWYFDEFQSFITQLGVYGALNR